MPEITIRPEPIRHRWINPTSQRYYQAELVQDLFGWWTLVTFFGGLQNRKGNCRLTAVASFSQGLRELEALDRRRQRRGYLPAAAYTPSPKPMDSALGAEQAVDEGDNSEQVELRPLGN